MTEDLDDLECNFDFVVPFGLEPRNGGIVTTGDGVVGTRVGEGSGLVGVGVGVVDDLVGTDVTAVGGL